MPLLHYLQIVVPQSLFGPLDYCYEGDTPPPIGSIVMVPFRNKQLLGIVWGHHAPTIPKEKIRAIQGLTQLSPLSSATQRFLTRAAQYYIAPLGALWKQMVPALALWHEKKDAVITSKAKQSMLPPEKSLLGHDGLPRFARNDEAITLSPLQQQSLEAMLPQMLSPQFSVTLLDGVTGSGKTEVYAEALLALLAKRSGQVLILLPEIALTPQLTERLTARMGAAIGVWHSDLTPKERLRTITGLMDGSIRVVIGARSAVFLPFPTLIGMVVDEEHEAAYKQEEEMLYHGRDMAILRAQCENIPIILASATPSLETLYHAMQGKYHHVELPARHGASTLPQVHVVDMRAYKDRNWISPPLHEAIARTLAQGKQAMLFLNRRGYAPISLCRSCGHRMSCPDCAVCLVEHRHTGESPVLFCHHCGYHQPVPTTCPECQTAEPLLPIGPGVERLSEILAHAFPQARILTLSRDTMTTIKKISQAIQAINAHEVDLIIGTQMIAKGHNFPAVECVGIIDADLGLFGMDVRATERSFQLLHQVGGRAGRHSNTGEVWLQSYAPDSSLVHTLMQNDRNAFMEMELAQRRASKMPPFSKLAALIVSGRDEKKTEKAAKTLASSAPVHADIEILGPTPAPLAMIRKRYRYRLLVRTTQPSLLQPYLQHLIAHYRLPPQVELRVDIDPYSFM